jgi:hypothetical protein
MIALAGNLTGDNTLIAIAFMARLVALAAAVTELRQAQQHAAQAAAARTAAAHLRGHRRSPLKVAALRPCPIAAKHPDEERCRGRPPRPPSRFEADPADSEHGTTKLAAAGTYLIAEDRITPHWSLQIVKRW